MPSDRTFFGLKALSYLAFIMSELSAYLGGAVGSLVGV